MNPDPFEQQLQRRPLPQLPPDWRAEILGAAAEARAEQERTETPARGIAWTHVRWGALAAVWVAIMTIRQLDPADAESPVQIASQAEILHGLEERQRLLAEFTEGEPEASRKAPVVVPRNRSGFHPRSLKRSADHVV